MGLEDILSEDEIGALLDSLDDGGMTEAPRRILEYDFARPDKLNPDQIRALTRMYDTVAQEMENYLTRLLRIGVEVSLVSLGQLSFDVFRASLSTPTIIQVLRMTGGREPCLLTADSKLSFGLIDRLLGGVGRSLKAVRPLTVVEENLIEGITNRWLTTVSESWTKLQEFDFSVIERESDPQFAQVIPAGEMVLVATYSVQSAGELEPGELAVCIPFINLELAIHQLNSQTRFAVIEDEQTDDQRHYIDRVVNASTVPCQVELGTAKITLGDLLGLAEGDVVVLDQFSTAPVIGAVGDRVKFLGKPGQLGRKRAVEVQALAPDGDLQGVNAKEGGHAG